VFENFEEFKKVHEAFVNLIKEKMTNEGIQMTASRSVLRAAIVP